MQKKATFYYTQKMLSNSTVPILTTFSLHLLNKLRFGLSQFNFILMPFESNLIVKK